MTTKDKMNQIKGLINSDETLSEYLRGVIAESILYSDNYDEEQAYESASTAISNLLNKDFNNN